MITLRHPRTPGRRKSGLRALNPLRLTARNALTQPKFTTFITLCRPASSSSKPKKPALHKGVLSGCKSRNRQPAKAAAAGTAGGCPLPLCAHCRCARRPFVLYLASHRHGQGATSRAQACWRGAQRAAAGPAGARTPPGERRGGARRRRLPRAVPAAAVPRGAARRAPAGAAARGRARARGGRAAGRAGRAARARAPGAPLCSSWGRCASTTRLAGAPMWPQAESGLHVMFAVACACTGAWKGQWGPEHAAHPRTPGAPLRPLQHCLEEAAGPGPWTIPRCALPTRP
jgi:hypothetical protein